MVMKCNLIMLKQLFEMEISNVFHSRCCPQRKYAPYSNSWFLTWVPGLTKQPRVLDVGGTPRNLELSERHGQCKESEHLLLGITGYLYSSVDGATCEQAILYDTTSLVRLVQHNEGSLEDFKHWHLAVS